MQEPGVQTVYYLFYGLFGTLWHGKIFSSYLERSLTLRKLPQGLHTVSVQVNILRCVQQGLSHLFDRFPPLSQTALSFKDFLFLASTGLHS